jgi:hypothetical protein
MNKLLATVVTAIGFILPLADLSYRFWIKASNFQRLFKFLPPYVATIKMAYIEVFPCLYTVNTLL